MLTRSLCAQSVRAALVATTAARLLVAQQAPTTSATQYPHSAEPIGTVRQMYNGALTPDLAVSTFRNIDRLFPTRLVPRSAKPLPLPPARNELTTLNIIGGGRDYSLYDYIDFNRVAGLIVLKDGRVAFETYRFGNSENTRWMSMSIAKSITSTLFGAAVKQGLIRLSDSVTQYVPSLAGSAYDGVTVRDILMMSSGVRWNETYTDSSSDRRHLLEAQISQKPGAAMEVMKHLSRAAPIGTVNNYSTGETQVAAEVLRSAIGRSLSSYLGERIWSRVGMESDANWWLDSPDGLEIGGSGFSATLRDYARFGQFLLNGGVAGGDSILPSGWLAEATSPKVLKGGKPLAYGYFWWTPPSGLSLDDHVYAGRGIFGQHLYIDPKEHVVAVVWSAQTRPTGGDAVNEWAFFDAVVRAVR
jgi:CubicO group peptidase (beta-lactamase class C family)